MSLGDDVRECPATYGLAASWIAVYLAMIAFQGSFRSESTTLIHLGAIHPGVHHLFGDLTWRDFAAGQVWRVVTATFLHANLPHLLMNLVGIVQLGWLIEPWYGARQFLALCLGMGASANLFGLLARRGVGAAGDWLQARGLARALPEGLAGGSGGATIATLGGSTIILGLIGLGLVVGWRSRTRVGAFLRDQMATLLALTALIGLLASRLVDNYGHAGGAIAGAAVGLLHRRLRLIDPSARPIGRRIAGRAVVVVVALSAIAQGFEARREIRAGRRAEAIDLASRRLGAIRALPAVIEAVRLPAEILAFDRTDTELTVALGRDDLTPFATIDPAPLLEVYALGASRIDGQRLALIAGLRASIERLVEIRTALDPDFAGRPEFDVVIGLGHALLTGPVDSRRLVAFRLAVRTLLADAAGRAEGSARRLESLQSEP